MVDDPASDEVVLAALTAEIERATCLSDEDAQRYAEGILDGYRVAIRRLVTSPPGTHLMDPTLLPADRWAGLAREAVARARHEEA